jgi:predicted hydrocarbon binding protein
MSDERKTDNFSMRTYLMTIENIIGSNGLKSILNYGHLEKYIDNFPPDNEELVIPLEDLQRLLFSLYQLFGQKGARSLRLRVGREIFRVGIEKRPKVAKTLQLASRLIPETKRMRLVLEKLAEYDWKAFSSHLEKPSFEIQEEEECFVLIDKDRYESEGMTSQEPVCGVFVGAAEAIVEWITGKYHEVEEIECRAMGHSADVFRISKTAKEM